MLWMLMIEEPDEYWNPAYWMDSYEQHLAWHSGLPILNLTYITVVFYRLCFVFNQHKQGLSQLKCLHMWAVSLDPRPNRTWGCACICFSILRMHVVYISLHRIARRSSVFNIVIFIDRHRAICQHAKKSHVYLELSANCQKSTNMHAQKNAYTFRFVC